MGPYIVLYRRCTGIYIISGLDKKLGSNTGIYIYIYTGTPLYLINDTAASPRVSRRGSLRSHHSPRVSEAPRTSGAALRASLRGYKPPKGTDTAEVISKLGEFNQAVQDHDLS